MPDDIYLSIDGLLTRDDDSPWTEDNLMEFVDAFIDFIEELNLSYGGSFSTMPEEEEDHAAN